jgi:2-oxoglutarate ferredoxin oxidoreductase subunit beta
MVSKVKTKKNEHPLDSFIRPKQEVTDFCPGCGIAISANSFVQAMHKSEFRPGDIRVISSNLGCVGAVTDYLNLDLYKTRNGDSTELAAYLKKRKNKSKTAIFLSDIDFISGKSGDLSAIANAGDGVILIYINTLIYLTFVYYKHIDTAEYTEDASKDISWSPRNIPLAAKLAGADYTARWSSLHVRRLTLSMRDALSAKGLSVIEVVSPCLMYHINNDGFGDFDRNDYIYNNTSIKHDEEIDSLDIRPGDKIIVGKFLSRLEA